MIRKELRWYPLFSTQQELEDQFVRGETRIVKSTFGDVLLVKKRETFYAFETRCPHQRKPLEGSWVENDKIVCPMHQYRFSLKDGRGHGMCLDRYPLRISNDGVFIGKERWVLGF